MPFVASLLHIVATLFNMVCQVFYWLLIIRIILSWVGVTPYSNFNEAVAVIYNATDFLLRPFRRLPLTIGPIDFSPILVFFLLQLAQRWVVDQLLRLAANIS